jgi:hypothetical protein
MSTTAAIILALAIGSITLFSTLFVVVLFLMRNRWEQIGDPKQPNDSHDSSDS